MKPLKHDIEILRGTTFVLEIVSQKKVYNYDPAVNTTPGDLQRTYEENLEFHGFVYAFVDFAAVYDKAEMTIRKAHIKSGQIGTPLMELSLLNNDIKLSNKGVVVTINSPDTEEIEFNEGVYELLLIASENLEPTDQAAGIDPNDLVDGYLYGEVTVIGEKTS